MGDWPVYSMLIAAAFRTETSKDPAMFCQTLCAADHEHWGVIHWSPLLANVVLGPPSRRGIACRPTVSSQRLGYNSHWPRQFGHSLLCVGMPSHGISDAAIEGCQLFFLAYINVLRELPTCGVLL